MYNFQLSRETPVQHAKNVFFNMTKNFFVWEVDDVWFMFELKLVLPLGVGKYKTLMILFVAQKEQRYFGDIFNTLDGTYYRG